MSTAEIAKTKSDLIDWIEKLSNVDVLHTLETIKATEANEDIWDTLPESHKNSIMRGVEQVKNGQTIPSEEFWSRLKNG